MKKIFLTLLAIVAASPLFAQTFTLDLHEKICAGSASDQIIECYTSITNNSQDSLFEWDKVALNVPSNWAVSFCDPNNCYTSISNTTQFKLLPGKTNFFKLQSLTNGNAGSSDIKIAIRLISNPSSTDTLLLSSVAWSTGINKPSNQNILSVFPNPVNNELHVLYSGKNGVQAEISDMLGSIQQQVTLQTGTNQINVNALPSGLYFLRIKDGTTILTTRFIKQ